MLPPIRFLEPSYLWLLLVPGMLLLVWAWLLSRRRRTVRRYQQHRIVPVRERYAYAGGLSFWLYLVMALTSLIMALARPQALVMMVQRAGVDFVVLQDGSTSMRVTDVAPDRWRRSTAWLRTFAETLSWSDERVALALFGTAPRPRFA